MKDSGMLLKENQLIINTKMVQNHIKAILKKDERYDNLSMEQKEEFINSLDKEQFDKIFQWFLDQPTPEIKIEWECSGCKTKNVVSEVDLINFFAG